MKQLTLIATLFLTGIIFTEMTQAAVIRIPDDAPDIQAAVNDASDGDTLIAAPGTYTGSGNRNIDFTGKAITLLSESGAEDCVIDCEHLGRGFYFHSGEDYSSILAGFTIRNGNAPSGGGIYCQVESSPLITDCTIIGNTAELFGGGIFCNYYCSPLITNCCIIFNSATHTDNGKGGGIHCSYNCSPYITNSIVSWNFAYNGGGIYSVYSSPKMFNCLISENYSIEGAGFYSRQEDAPMIANCTFFWNTAVWLGGGISIKDDSTPYILNSIVYGNSPSEIYFPTGDPVVEFSDVGGGFSGTGNIDGNPLFVTGPEGYYYLSQEEAGQQTDSPCIDAGGDAAENVCFDTAYWFVDQSSVVREVMCMSDTTSRTDEIEDQGTVDMGYHYPLFDSTGHPSPTPDAGNLGARLEMPAYYFSSGDVCWLKVHLTNPEGPMDNIPLFVLLQIADEFWFWDSWTHEVDYNRVNLPSGNTTINILDYFTWPDTGSLEMDNITFLAGMTDASMSGILGGTDGIGEWNFGFGL